MAASAVPCPVLPLCERDNGALPLSRPASPRIVRVVVVVSDSADRWRGFIQRRRQRRLKEAARQFVQLSLALAHAATAFAFFLRLSSDNTTLRTRGVHRCT
jgi:hypothetical protein